MKVTIENILLIAAVLLCIVVLYKRSEKIEIGNANMFGEWVVGNADKKLPIKFVKKDKETGKTLYISEEFGYVKIISHDNSIQKYFSGTIDQLDYVDKNTIDTSIPKYISAEGNYKHDVTKEISVEDVNPTPANPNPVNPNPANPTPANPTPENPANPANPASPPNTVDTSLLASSAPEMPVVPVCKECVECPAEKVCEACKDCPKPEPCPKCPSEFGFFFIVMTALALVSVVATIGLGIYSYRCDKTTAE